MAFKSDPDPTSSSSDDNAAVVLAAAAAVSPVNELNAANRAALCRTASVVHVQRNDVVKPEGTQRWVMYLVDGSLSLFKGKEEAGSIAAKDGDALQPLFRDKTDYQTARTNTVARIVRFGREQLEILLREQQKNAIHVVDVEVGELDNLVFDDVVASMRANKPTLGSSSEAAAKILAALPKVTGIPELAEIIQSDPGLTAHIVESANRTEATGDWITSIRGAISRLGVEATRRNVESLLQSNTLVPANAVIEKRFRRFVQRSTLSAAIVQVLARNVPDLKPEVAALTALTADIGELLVLTYANEHAARFENEGQLAGVISNLRPILGPWLLSSWNFSPSFVESCSVSRDWYRNHSGEITCTDLVTAALLIIQSEMPDTEHSSIPNADNLLLARRLQQAGIDLKAPGDIVRAATGRIVSVQALLKTG